MIIDSHGWVTEKKHWGIMTPEIMDNSAAEAGWTKTRGMHAQTGIVGRYKLPDLIEMMDEMGVDRTVTMAMTRPLWNGKVPNEFVANNVKQYPDRLIGLGSVHDIGGLKAVKELEEIYSLGLQGIKLAPHTSSVYPWDERIWPVYEKCQDLGLIVYFHTGWSGTFELHGKVHGVWKYQRVEHLDKVCVEFPKLRVVAAHAGIAEWKTCLMLMLKNKNLWANTDGLAAGYIPPEEYVLMVKNAKALGILNKLMWGTDNVDHRLDLPLAKSLPELGRKHNIGPTMPDITQEDMDLFLGHNAARLFNIKI